MPWMINTVCNHVRLHLQLNFKIRINNKYWWHSVLWKDIAVWVGSLNLFVQPFNVFFYSAQLQYRRGHSLTFSFCNSVTISLGGHVTLAQRLNGWKCVHMCVHRRVWVHYLRRVNVTESLGIAFLSTCRCCTTWHKGRLSNESKFKGLHHNK